MGCSVAVLGAGTYLVVDALPSQAATSGLRTATVATGSVTQSTSLSGSVERVDQVTAAFRTAGTVTSVKVAVGDEVEAGDVLATIDTADLTRAVTVAQANLVAAQAALDAADSSSSSSLHLGGQLLVGLRRRLRVDPHHVGRGGVRIGLRPRPLAVRFAVGAGQGSRHHAGAPRRRRASTRWCRPR